MAITGIDTIEGKQIIAAGAVSAKSAEMAYNDENGYPITGYQVAGDYYSASNPSGFITGVDLSDYATTAELADKQDITGMTAYQPVGNYQTAGDYLTTADSGNFYPMTGNPSGFINELPEEEEVEFEEIDLADYQPSGNYYSASNPSGFITGVPDTYLQNTDLEISDNKITGISGVPLAAGGGGDVPEGVMAESGLEYNAVDEISGYNGSAFAQYGAEKQWLVHDDTLVHASNSAQYALGVNVSAVQSLMGLDETVILDRGTDDLVAPNTAQLSEPFSAFDKIEMWCVWNPWPTNVPQATYYPGDASGGSYMVFDNSQYMRAGYGLWRVTGTTIQLISASQTTNWPTFQGASTGLGGIRKIVGIGRKEV